jgi:RNA polymerase sigma-70 factor (ECF subfamily)
VNVEDHVGRGSHALANCERQQVQAWIAEAKSGSSAALGRLIEGCRNYLLAIAKQELSEGLRAKMGPSDLVQETSLEAFRDFSSFQGEQLEELLGWMRRILLNNASHASRRFEQTGKRNVARELNNGLSSSTTSALPAHGDSPSARLMAIEQREVVDRCLSHLTQDMRSAIILRNREHLSFSEIGLQLGRSAEAARKLWARAVLRLQEELSNAYSSN